VAAPGLEEAMNASVLRAAGLLLAAIVVFASGFMLTRGGRPHGTGLLTVHKLVALAAVVVIGAGVVQYGRSGALTPVAIAVAAAAAVCVVAAFASGGILSAKATPPSIVARLHAVVPWLTAVASAATVYMTTV
jgi:hypothetical protein